jgi:RNA polymerase sigma factor (sigma-70 family)
MERTETDGTGRDVAALVAAAGGDPTEQAVFAAVYGELVRKWLWFRWRHGPLRGLIEDAVQEVFVECLRPGGALQHLDPGRAVHGPAAFLRGVVQHVAQRIERSEARRLRTIRERLADSPTVRPDPPEQGDADWARARIATALDMLDRGDRASPPHRSLRQFLRLHFEDGLPVRAIARLWHEPAQRVQETRRRACRRFRDCLVRVVQGKDPGHQAGPEETGASVAREVLQLLQ